MKKSLSILIVVAFSILVTVYCIFIHNLFKDRAPTIQDGSLCSLYIPSLNIKVPVYNSATGAAQSVVDKENAAAHLEWHSHDVFVDHQCQAFKNLANATPNVTIAYLIEHQTVNTYVCLQKMEGIVVRTTECGAKIYGREIDKYFYSNDNAIFIYTCSPQQNDYNNNITITYWQPVNAM